ncbi:hypothetical protein B5M09_009766 [Aphanomyces astaci]|uniref:HECT-type E3 ubiquitin transferase n=1 Tax=Aphanomyces astaci TaxID=112090 RepID=A0A425CWP7_APHAT|nr:hypothetical protein B5M09_009766 [Aphanomyces astaci]
MGARVSASAKRIAVERLHVAGSDESEFDLDEEEKRIKDLQDKNKQVVTYVVENLFPYAPVSIKIQRLDTLAVDSTTEIASPAKEKQHRMHSYLWITLDDLILKQQNVPLDATISYPLVVAIDNSGNAYVTDRNNGQRKLKSSDLLALATAKVPPLPPDPVRWKESNGSIVDRFEVQYKPWNDLPTLHKPWQVLLTSLMPSHSTLSDLSCHSAFAFRAKCHNPAFTCQRTDEVPPEVLAARQGGAADAEDSREMAFRKKRFHFHRELRLCVPPQTAPFEVTLARPTMFADTVARFHRASKKELQHKPRVTFEGEGGIDSGGLTKDWYLQVSKQAAHRSHGLFRPLGKFLGKAIFDRQVVRLPLAPVLYKHLVGLAISWDDFVGLDPQFSKSLHWIQHNDVTNVLYETFSITRSNNIIVDLKENGRNVDVTEANKAEYVQLMVQWRTEFAVRPQLDALLHGMHMLLPPASLHGFEWGELEMLLNGNPVIDVDLLRCNVHFQGGYDATAQVILWLWQALRAWDNSTRQMFLQFATGSPAMPLDGFDPPLTITKSDLEATALPRSHTCFNQLVLPEYQSFSVLSAKLVFAMQNTEGFELS